MDQRACSREGLLPEGGYLCAASQDVLKDQAGNLAPLAHSRACREISSCVRCQSASEHTSTGAAGKAEGTKQAAQNALSLQQSLSKTSKQVHNDTRSECSHLSAHYLLTVAKEKASPGAIRQEGLVLLARQPHSLKLQGTDAPCTGKQRTSFHTGAIA